MHYGPVRSPSKEVLMSLNLQHMQKAKSSLTRIEELEDKIIEINSALDAREREILDLYARIDSLEDLVKR